MLEIHSAKKVFSPSYTQLRKSSANLAKKILAPKLFELLFMPNHPALYRAQHQAKVPWAMTTPPQELFPEKSMSTEVGDRSPERQVSVWRGYKTVFQGRKVSGGFKTGKSDLSAEENVILHA